MHAGAKARPSQMATRTTQDCAAICVETVQYCLEVGGSHAAPAHVQLLQDCADICATTANFVLRASTRQGGQAGASSHGASSHQDSVTSACADICDLCAASCETFAADAQMKACANQCYLCATACRQLLTSMGGRAEMGQRQ
jgi:hypothetical protein